MPQQCLLPKKQYLSVAQSFELRLSGVDPELRRLLWYLLAGSRGGENRIKIIEFLHERPYNINQLAQLLGIDYKAVEHHMDVLQKNSLVLTKGEKYGVLYFLTPYLEAHYDTFKEICNKIGWSKHSASAGE